MSTPASNSPPAGAQPAGPAGSNPASINASLYVGDLAQDVNEPLLYEIFSQVGPVASIRVCRDAITRRSLGYAYVNMQNPVDAERALDTLNYTPIKGKPCRIMWKNRDPSNRKTGQSNVFIKNLDESIDHRALNDTFSAFGNITSCKVAMDPKGVSKGYGFVCYDTEEEANTAIAKVNGMLLNGKKVFVGNFRPKSEREKDEEFQKFNNIFVKNLPESWDTAKLKEVCASFGEITQDGQGESAVVVMKDAEGKSKCFGFCNFETSDAARAAVESLNSKEEDGKEIYAGKAEKKGKREEELKKAAHARRAEQAAKFRGVNLYVKNLDDTVDDEKLREKFGECGSITSCRIMTDDKQNSRGFGFVCFSTPEEATRAVTAMNGQMLGSKPIYVALHQPKHVRQQMLEAQYAAMQSRRMDGGGMGGPGMGGQGGPPGMYRGPGGPHQHQQMMMFPQAMVPGMQPRWMQGGGPGGGMGGMPGGMQMAHRQQRGGFRGGRGGRGGPGRNQQQGQQQGFKLTSGVRNAEAPQMPQQSMQQPAQPAHQQAEATAKAMDPNEPLSASTLAAMTPEQQKQALGERLFAAIASTEERLAGKITGMLLELDNGELLHLLQDPQALLSKMNEAISALEQHAPE